MSISKLLLFLFIISLPCGADDPVGSLTREGQETYSPVIDSLKSYYESQKRRYSTDIGSDNYRWELVDPISYPQWCADSHLIPRKVYSVIITQKGVTFLIFKDILEGTHVIAAASSWISRKGAPASKTYRMWYFLEGPGHRWVSERPAIKTVVNRAPDGSYCDCDRAASKKGD